MTPGHREFGRPSLVLEFVQYFRIWMRFLQFIIAAMRLAGARGARGARALWFMLPIHLQRRTDMVSKNTICLWFNNDALDAARFYAETFPDSAVGAIHLAPSDYPSGKEGDVLTVEFTVAGIPCIGLNGGPGIQHNIAFSFQIATDDQAETDRLWNAIIGHGGTPNECGWCQDKWGLSWQITPRVLTAAYTNPDRAVAKRAFEAMMGMGKIDVAKIEAAVRG
jgi:predicted 3-demethylubiquinone-9 3-methyltransferase (glyoxalase superfamily)